MSFKVPEDVERRCEGERRCPDEEHGDEGAHGLETAPRGVYDELRAKKNVPLI